jgi:oxygen-independent coproporphyrinogen-3 oxidase
MLAPHVLDRYNYPVPRYTSYPPATFFHEGFAADEALKAIDASNADLPSQVSFYLHLPFCRQLCTYCGCNAYPMGNGQSVQAYLDALEAEIDLVLPRIDPTRRISQIHFGGGSPTAIPTERLKALIYKLTSALRTTDDCEIAIECHPGYLSLSDWEQLADAGFNRFSIGVQDLNPKVLEAVHRVPSSEDIGDVVALLKGRGLSVNLDFIYGLPLQTVEDFTRSMAQAAAWQPDRLVTFSYAHVPWVHPAQKHLERKGLPEAGLKSALYETAVSTLTAAGYRRIGMDHFVRPGDELDLAVQTGKLHRNFQGYCTWETTGQVYAFGATAISQLHACYFQHTKHLADYIDCLKRGVLPVAKGYRLSPAEQRVKELITGLMCNGKIDWAAMAERLGYADATAFRNSLNLPYDTLRAMEADGLLTLTDTALCMTEDGSRFVRNVAALFDPLFKPGTAGYSLPL